MRSLSPRAAGLLFALVTACGLGAITTQAKLVYADGGNALTLMLMRFLASTLVFGAVMLVRRGSFRVAPRDRLPLAALGLIWSGAMICYLRSVETLSVSLAVLILYIYPLLVLGYSLLRRELRPSAALIALFGGAFFGLYLALSGGVVRLAPAGLLLAAAASLGAAFTFVCGARVAPRMSPLAITFWINTTGLLLILPLMPGNLAWPAGIGGMLALTAATVFYIVAILSQFEALARLPAARAAFLLNLEPVVSILLARLVLAEVLSIVQWSGVILVVSMVLLSLRFKSEDA